MYSVMVFVLRSGLILIRNMASIIATCGVHGGKLVNTLVPGFYLVSLVALVTFVRVTFFIGNCPW